MEELRQAIISEDNSRTKERLLAILYFIKFGMHPRQIASEMKRSIRTIQNWIRRYMKEGIAGLADKPRSGRPRKLRQSTLDEFMGQITKPITPEQIMLELIEKYGCKYTLSHIRALMHEYGYSIKTTQKRHVNAAPLDEVREWRRKILPKIRRYEKAGYVVFVTDESHFVYDARITRKYWTPIGVPIYISNNGAHQKITMFGAISTNGRQFFRRYDKLDAATFEDYLMKMHKAHDKILVIADRAPAHTAKQIKDLLKSNKDIKLEYFPRGSPYLNGVEECWRQMKPDLLSEYYETKEDMKKAITKYLRTTRFKLAVRTHLKRDPPPEQKVMEWIKG